MAMSPWRLCAYCWVKNVEAHWSIGTSVGFYATFRSVLRDSYIHETPDPNPGGGGIPSRPQSGARPTISSRTMSFGTATRIS